MDKKGRLQGLKKRMEERFRLDFPGSRLWFFQDACGRVDGYFGTDPVVFVGQRPSTGRGGLAHGALGGFYDLLREYGFAHAHITDVVKEQMEVGLPSDEQVDRNWPYFLEELQIVEPKIIVALGGWVFYTLEQRLDWLVPLRRFTHYSYRFRSQIRREQDLRADFQRLKRTLESADTRCCAP